MYCNLESLNVQTGLYKSGYDETCKPLNTRRECKADRMLLVIFLRKIKCRVRSHLKRFMQHFNNGSDSLEISVNSPLLTAKTRFYNKRLQYHL